MDELKGILTEAQARLAADPGPGAVDWLANQLGTKFDEAISEGGLSEFQEICRSHPLAETFLLDPYAKRASEKPRGYAGDAVMLDYIYRPNAELLSGLAATIHGATTTLPNAKSILWRRDYLAALIDQKMRINENASVLSIASGHMRELDVLRDISPYTNVRFTALDTDAMSIAEAQSTYTEYQIKGEVKNFTYLIRAGIYLGQYDLVYSAGLLDYLSDSTAIALIKAMFLRLSPGGVLSIGNFSRDSHGRGFMAGFMDWCLIYRSEEDLRRLADAACPKATHRIFRDQPRNVVYLEVFADRPS